MWMGLSRQPSSVSGDRVRITAQLIYGPSDKYVWANSSLVRALTGGFIVQNGPTRVRWKPADLKRPEKASAPAADEPKAKQFLLQSDLVQQILETRITPNRVIHRVYLIAPPHSSAPSKLSAAVQ
jgi:hypothetical protein